MEFTPKQINIITTGGTIDSRWDPTSDTITPFKATRLQEVFDLVKSYDEISFTEICMKDSREVNHDDRLAILEHIQKSEKQYFVITHGTYTMSDTARYLAAHLGDHTKKIILTGSMVPAIGFTPSDGGFNLGASIASFNWVEPGIYVCMNGRVFDSAEIAKEISEGRFTSLFNK